MPDGEDLDRDESIGDGVCKDRVADEAPPLLRIPVEHASDEAADPLLVKCGKREPKLRGAQDQ
jgi:hypothetical protein